jgi:hypothetical protein
MALMRLRSLVGGVLFLVSLAAPCTATSFVPGDILISNHNGNDVQLLDPVTSGISTLVNINTTPIGLALDTAGLVYINAGSGIQEYNPFTNTLNATFFSGIGQREGLTFDPVTNHLFSVSYGNNLVQEVDLAGNLVRNIVIPGSSDVLGISARGGNLVIGDYANGNIYEGTTTGSTFSVIGNSGAPSNTYGVDFDAAGNIFVNNFGGRTERFTSLGGGVFSGPTTFISGLSGPDNGLSIGDDGSFTISEYSSNTVGVFNANGSVRQLYSGVQNPDELVVYAPIRQGINPSPTVPEPGSLVLMGSGLVIAARRWQKRRKAGSAE